MSEWPTSPAHHRWLDQHSRDLLAFGRRTADPGGGARWLDARGLPDPRHPVSTLLSARMAHVYAVGTLLGVPGAAPIAQQALRVVGNADGDLAVAFDAGPLVGLQELQVAGDLAHRVLRVLACRRAGHWGSGT